MNKCIFITILFFGWMNPTEAQIYGCTDQRAINYNTLAIVNDGSCSYVETNYSLHLVGVLPDTIHENSTLTYWNNSLWTINDSDHEPRLFEINPYDASLIKSYFVKDVTNYDWEAIAQNDSSLFIGDIGNNLGNRHDLSILKISKSSILSTLSDTLKAEIIHFNFEDQTDFTPQNRQTKFDCEAMFWKDDSLHLFTKDWVSNRTVHYVIPDIPGHHIALRKGSFNVEGLITDAAFDPISKNIVLIGYSSDLFQGFTWLLSEYPSNNFFEGNKRRIKIGSTINIGQVEGICLENSHKGYISGERINKGTIHIPAKLYTFDFEYYFPDTLLATTLNNPDDTIIFPNPAINVFKVRLHNPVEMKVYNQKGKLQQRKYLEAGVQKIDCSKWKRGIYHLQFGKGDFKQIIIE